VSFSVLVAGGASGALQVAVISNWRVTEAPPQVFAQLPPGSASAAGGAPVASEGAAAFAASSPGPLVSAAAAEVAAIQARAVRERRKVDLIRKPPGIAWKATVQLSSTPATSCH
jgi:hypothetical protein